MGELGLNVKVTDAAFPGTEADTFLACEVHVADALRADWETARTMGERAVQSFGGDNTAQLAATIVLMHADERERQPHFGSASVSLLPTVFYIQQLLPSSHLESGTILAGSAPRLRGMYLCE